MHDHAFREATVIDGHRQRIDSDPGLHPGLDRVADDLVVPQILDRTAVQFPLVSPVFGDVGDPHLVRAISDEQPLHEVIMDRRAGLAVLAFAAGDPLGDPRNVAQPPHAPLRDLVAQIVEVVSQHTVAALGIVLVEFVQHLDEVPLFLLASRNRLLAPLVVPLLREAQYPARHRHRHP